MGGLIFFVGMMLVLGVGGFIADYIFPHVKPLARYIDDLPMMDDCECEEEPEQIFGETKTLMREETL